MRAKLRITVLSTLFILFNLLAVVSLDRAFGRTQDLNRQSSSESIQRKPGADAGENILEPGRTIKRELAAGQRHIYRINLGADQFLRAIVEQDRIDVVVLLSGPDGKQITEFDAGYYERLLKGEGRGAALRQMQLEMLKDAKLRHPYYWANFIQAGDGSSLDGHSER